MVGTVSSVTPAIRRAGGLSGKAGSVFPQKRARDAHIARTLGLFSELA